MKLLSLSFGQVDLFKKGRLSLDLFASDRVADDRGVTLIDPPVYTQNILAFAGINATGKTTTLNLLLGALGVLMGRPVTDRFENSLMDVALDRVTMNCTFFHDGIFYGLSSIIASRATDDSSRGERWEFVDEKLWSLGRIVTKKTLSSFDQFTDGARFEYSRKDLPANLLDYLPSNVSMVTAITKNSEQFLPRTVYSDDQWLRLSDSAIDKTVLQVFDSSIHLCERSSQRDCYALSFKNDTSRLVLSDKDSLGMILSDGTVKGANLVQQAILALRTGGYLLIDEIENHLNKQLVGVILDLFESNETNPKGALLVFSTHYPEILDFIKRKDNVYFFTRDEDHHVEVTKYSSVVKRIENKKSEVFLSNYIKGTAPRYSAVSSLKSHIIQLVAGGEE